MGKIIAYNLTEDFILQISDFVEENYLKEKKDISRLAFVFGGKRPELFLKRELAKRIKKGFISPRFFSMDEFVEYLFSKKISFKKIPILDSVYIIYELAKKNFPPILLKREKFYQFLPWAKEIMLFFEQLDLEMISDLMLKSIKLKAGLGYDAPEEINRLLENIFELRKIYSEYLERLNLYPRGKMYFLTAKYIGDIDISEFEKIFFCGLFYLHKTEIEIIKNIYTREKAILFFQGDMDEWPSLKKIAEELSTIIKPEKNSSPSFNLSIQAGFDVHSEVGLVREIVKKIENLDKTAIVLPEPDNLIPLLSEVTSFVKEYNVSLGYPLKRSSLFSLFQKIFKAQQTKKKDLYYSPDYLMLLSHPLVKNLSLEKDPALTRILIHKIEEILRGEIASPLGGSLFVKLSEIENCSQIYENIKKDIKDMGLEFDWYKLRKLVKKLHDTFFRAWEDFNNFQDFSSFLEEFMDFLLKYSFLENYPLNLKMAERIFLVNEEFKNVRFKDVYFPKEEIFEIFQESLGNELISFSGSPLKGLQILGLLETRSLSFENVLVMDLNEAILPNLRTYEPLIPREVMVSLGLNRLEKEEEIQRYYFKRIISSAKNVFLIYQKREDRERSRFIEELIWEKQGKFGNLEIIDILQASFRVSTLPKKTEIKKGQDIIDYLEKFEYSSSSINTYLHCPLKFYYQYVLRLEERKDIFDEPEGRDIGSFIHELLKEAFSCFVGRRVLIDRKFEEEFFFLLERKFAEVFQSKTKSDAFLIEEVVKFRMDKFLEHERNREIKEIVCLEKTFKGKIEFNEVEFKLSAIVDRIDRLSDNSLLILDYKTGGRDLKPSNIERIKKEGFERKVLKKTLKSFQLPVYLHLIDTDKKFKGEKTNAGLYFIRGGLSKNQEISILIKEEDLENKEKIMEIYLKALEYILKEILDSKVPFQADEEDLYQCKNCAFVYLCR